jgi:toxin FitB
LTRYLLDTNIVSDATKPLPSQALGEWMTAQDDEEMFISSLAVAEICRGLLRLPAGRKRRELELWFAGPEGPSVLFAKRVLPFDEAAALIWARLMSEGDAIGRPRSAIDMMVAAIAQANDCVIVTDNERDFDGLAYVNPLKGSRSSSR